jgi:class 3 adenylate cyclase/tetratricopeptide (TPR) repeat protein
MCVLPLDPTLVAPVAGEASLASLTQPAAAPQAQSPPPQTKLHDLIPQELAEKLRAADADAGLVDQRRVVTILFCDITGSTAAAQQMDPEEWTEVVSQAFEIMIRPVYKYEGTVARMMGDAILAFFGAPIAHEDDPRRAVLAALDIVDEFSDFCRQVQARWQIDINVRVGINTGLVLVGNVGSDLQVEYTAMGDAINLAARMEQTAEPGTVQIAVDTYQRVAPLFEIDPLGAVDVKGRENPIETYRPLRPKDDPGRMRGIAGLDAPMIGRETEWQRIREVAGSAQRGVGQIVFLLGEAGLGKSRLIRELQDYLGAELSAFESASLSFESIQPYGLFQRLVRQVVGAQPSESPEVLRELIAVSLDGLEQTQEQGRKAFESLFGLTGVDGSPPFEGERFKQQLFETMAAFWKARAAERPLVLVFDDIHWSDPASLELVQHLLELTEESPLLIILASRPERDSGAWMLLQEAEARFAHRFTQITIRPLTEADSNTLVDSLLTISDLPQSLRRRILTRAEGNPFYVEEVVRSLIESEAVVQDASGSHWIAQSDGSDIDIPDNVQALITARIDRLDEQVRRTLQLAALIGRSFYFRVLKLIASHDHEDQLPEHLTELQRMDMIREAARRPELEYMFRHVLTQEAAYHTILIKERRRYHQRVGAVMAAIFSNVLEEHAPVLAYHFEEAGEHQEALDFYRIAGDQAMRLFANREAISHFTKALACQRQLAEPDLDTRIHLFRQRGRALELVHDYDAADQNYLDMLAIAEEHGDQRLELAALVARTTIHTTFTPKFDQDLGIELAERTMPLARAQNDGESQARIYWNLMLTTGFIRTDFWTAVGYGDKSLAMCQEYDLQEQLALTLNDLGRMYGFLGDFKRGMPLMQEATEMFKTRDNLPLLADNYNGRSLLALMSGRNADAIEFRQLAYDVSVSTDNRMGKRDAVWGVGNVNNELGKFDEALQSWLFVRSEYAEMGDLALAIKAYMINAYLTLGDVETAAEESQHDDPESGILLFVIIYAGEMARLLIAQGELAAARELVDRTYARMHRPEIAWLPLNMPFAHAEILLLAAEGDHEKAIERGQALLDVLVHREQNYYLPQVALAVARAHQHNETPDLGRAEVLLLQGLESSRQMETRPISWMILVELIRICPDERVDDWQEEALEAIDFIHDHAPDDRLQQSFLARIKREAPELALGARVPL